ncbi:uncharacterized protein [Typha latifolia]|uniref:uncharacterized protein n=1 Tax=Typha latifolia TaxID=4733 RepID=UPI003C30BE57
MDLDAVKRSLEPNPSSSSSSYLPPQFYESLVVHGLRVDSVEPGRVLCSLSIPPNLASSGSYLHGGVVATLADVVGSTVIFCSGFQTSGVSLEINVSYLDVAFINEEIEIEGKLLHAGKAVAVTSIDFRKKTGKMIAQARHTKYLAVSSKL